MAINFDTDFEGKLAFGATDKEFDETISRQTVKQDERTTTAETTGAQSENKHITLLDAKTQNQLFELIQQLGGNIQEGGAGNVDFTGELASISKLLTERAGTAESAVAEQSDAIIGEARRSGEQSLGQQVTGLTQATGSSQNSLVQAFATQGRNDLETQLASLSAELSLKGRELATGEFQGATQGLVAGADAGLKDVTKLAGITELLRGATATVSGLTNVSQTSAENESITSLIEELEKRDTETREKTRDFGSLIDVGLEFINSSNAA